MAFHGSTIEAISDDIKSRQAYVGRLSLIEFDDGEYEVLIHISREILRRYEGWWASRQKHARTVFLAFGIEYMRREHYVKEKFWDEFLNTLHTNMAQYELITEGLLWKAYEEEEIPRKTTGKGREFVLSLHGEVHASTATRKECIEFFCWYYQHSIASRLTPEIIARYETQTGKQLAVHEKALSALDKDCQLLIRIIDYAVEQEMFLVHLKIEAYICKITQELGQEYNPFRLRLLHDREKLRDIIIQLQNHRTPIQFLRELGYDALKVMYFPTGSHLYARTAHRQLRAETMAYGCYRLDGAEYRVVPLTWLRLEMIGQWTYEEFISLRNGTYLGYKKRQPFKVKIGRRITEGRECFLLNKERCYIWIDQVPRGDLLVIDGRYYEGTEGLDWQTSLELGFNEQKEVLVLLIFDSLKAFYPNRIGQRLTVRTSQGHEETTYSLDNEHGLCQLHRAIGFQLSGLEEPLVVSIDLAGKHLSSKTIEPESAYLFSTSTHKRIPSGTKREWGDSQYYLFVSPHEEVQIGDGIALEMLDVRFGPYTAYCVEWEDHTLPFSLHVEKLSWCFEKQRYLYLRVRHQASQSPVYLVGQQIHRFTQGNIVVCTNQRLNRDSSVTCHLLYMSGQEVLVHGGFKKCGDDQYSLDEMAIKHLNTLTADRHHYGKYELLFREGEQLLGCATVIVVPELQVALPFPGRPLVEGRTAAVNVSSPYLKLWDPRENQTSSSASFPIHPTLSVQPLQDEIQAPKGIFYLTSQPTTFPVTFPEIGETIEVRGYPSVFGFRLYQNKGQEANYQKVSILDYYALEASALYIHTKARSTVAMVRNEIRMWTGRTNEDGHLLVEDLSFLKMHCKREQTTFSVICEGQENTFLVCWKPLIHELYVEKDRVRLKVSGPIDTGVVLSLIESDGSVHSQERIACGGEQIVASIELPPIQPNWKQCYLVPQYYTLDGIPLPTAWQQRLEKTKLALFPLDWLRAGVGISSETLLGICDKGQY